MLNFRRNLFFVLSCFGLVLNGLPIAFAQQKEQSKTADSGEYKPKLRCGQFATWIEAKHQLAKDFFSK